MDSKTKIQNALNFCEGEIPIDIGSTSVTGIHVSVVEKLRKAFHLAETIVKVHEPSQMLGYIDDELKESIGIDTNGVFPFNTSFGIPANNWKEWETPWGQKVLIPEKMEIETDNENNCFVFPQGDKSVPPSAKMPKGSYFFDAIIRQDELHEDQLNPDDNVEEYAPLTSIEIKHFKQEIENSRKSSRATVATFGGTAFGDVARIPGIGLKHPKGIRDIEEWYVSTLLRPDFIHSVFEKQLEIALTNLDVLFQNLPYDPDVIYVCGTDFGTQNSLFCSPNTFENLYAPYYRAINDWIHENTSSKTMKHCCGSIRSLIPNLIEAGFDILNPVQISADNMDPMVLKSEFGKHIVFWGGGIDTQKTLPFATPEKVYQEVISNCKILSKAGGFVFNTVHNIQAETPIENVMAMIKALHDFNNYDNFS